MSHLRIVATTNPLHLILTLSESEREIRNFNPDLDADSIKYILNEFLPKYTSPSSVSIECWAYIPVVIALCRKILLKFTTIHSLSIWAPFADSKYWVIADNLPHINFLGFMTDHIPSEARREEFFAFLKRQENIDHFQSWYISPNHIKGFYDGLRDNTVLIYINGYGCQSYLADVTVRNLKLRNKAIYAMLIRSVRTPDLISVVKDYIDWEVFNNQPFDPDE